MGRVLKIGGPPDVLVDMLSVHIEHFRDEEEEYIYYLSVDGLRIPISEEACRSLRALGISRTPKRVPYFSPEALWDLPLSSDVKNLLSEGTL